VGLTTHAGRLAEIFRGAASGLPRVVVLTYASHPGALFPVFLRSALLNGLAPVVLGWRRNAANALRDKIDAVSEEIRAYDEATIVLFIDSFDVLVSASLDEIAVKFRSFGAPIVFSAEKGCWPFHDGRPGGEAVARGYPPSPTPWRYLNSGGYIGCAGALRALLHEMSMLPEATNPWCIDQELASLIYLRGQPKIALDHRCEIFMNVHLSWKDLTFVPGVIGRGSAAGRWQNRVTGTFPSILHFNGGAKHEMSRFERRLGYATQAVDGSLLAQRERKILLEDCLSVRLTATLSHDRQAPRPPDRPEQLILGAALGYPGVHALEPFARSLRESCYRGRCRVLLSRGDIEAETFLGGYGIETEAVAVVNARMMRWAGRHGLARQLRALERVAGRTCALLAPASHRTRAALAVCRRAAPLAPLLLRDVLYLEQLASRQSRAVTDVLLIDPTRELVQPDPRPASGAAGPRERAAVERDLRARIQAIARGRQSAVVRPQGGTLA
jgi:hypothetical protein